MMENDQSILVSHSPSGKPRTIVYAPQILKQFSHKIPLWKNFDINGGSTQNFI